MASGFVYLRPKTVAYFRETGPRCTAADLAWSKMNAWLEKHDLRNEIDRGFGISQMNLPNGSPDYYDACVELPLAISAASRSELKFQKLPGGAYARSLHKGSHDLIGGIIADLKKQQQGGTALAFDCKRPTIEIFLNDRAKVPVDKLRTDVCLPVSSHSNGNSHQRAA